MCCWLTWPGQPLGCCHAIRWALFKVLLCELVRVIRWSHRIASLSLSLSVSSSDPGDRDLLISLDNKKASDWGNIWIPDSIKDRFKSFRRVFVMSRVGGFGSTHNRHNVAMVMERRRSWPALISDNGNLKHNSSRINWFLWMVWRWRRRQRRSSPRDCC